LQQKTRPPLAAAISEKPSTHEDRLELAAPLVKDLSGSPVVDGNGEVVGIVSTADEGAPPIVVRTSSARNQLLAAIPPDTSAKWTVAADGSAPPPPPWDDEPTPTPKPSPPIVSKLIHTPPPIYPMGARFSRPPIKGSGRFRVTFAATGEAKNVQVIQSTGTPMLDGAAVTALRQWRSAPGREWSTNVPVTFGR
jgi:protein TonB